MPCKANKLNYIRNICISLLIFISIADVDFAAAPIYDSNPAPFDWSKPGPEPFNFKPFAPTFEERRLAYLEYCAVNGKGSLYGDLCAVELGKQNTISDTHFQYHVDRLKTRKDCADFNSIRLIRAYYKNLQFHFMTPEQEAAARRAILDFKYWVDEPGDDEMISWTENHQILFHASEYLAGQLFPDEVFTNNGKTGAWHQEHAKNLILKWIDRRARWGFSEWDSNVYYEEDLSALTNLADLARDPTLNRLANMAVDLMLIDIGSDLFYGSYATSHGRTYYDSVLNGREDSTRAVTKLIWGVGSFRDSGASGATPIATGSYKPPAAIIALGQSFDLPEYQNLERHGIPLNKIKKYGLRFDNLDDVPALWGMGIYAQPEIVDTTLAFADQYRLWNHPFMKEASAIRGIPRSGSLGRTLRAMPPVEPYRTLLSEVNKISYRTPDYMLSSAQDYRPGEMGNQQHIWQAALSPDAVVFVTNPGSLSDTHERTPTFWGGQNRFPRNAQYRNVLISIYNIKNEKALGERGLYLFTHAHFPKAAFERVEESGGWIFGKAGDGYIALRSEQPYRWTAEGPEAGREIVADGAKNVWICVMGRLASDGAFEDFMARIKSAVLRISNLSVEFDAPGAGRVSFGWSGPLLVNGKEFPLDNYPRMENPFVRSEFDSGVYTITAGGTTLTLDFPKAVRKEEPAARGTSINK